MTSGDELVERVTMYEMLFEAPPVAEPSKANAAEVEAVVVVVETVEVDVVVD